MKHLIARDRNVIYHSAGGHVGATVCQRNEIYRYEPLSKQVQNVSISLCAGETHIQSGSKTLCPSLVCSEICPHLPNLNTQTSNLSPFHCKVFKPEPTLHKSHCFIHHCAKLNVCILVWHHFPFKATFNSAINLNLIK